MKLDLHTHTKYSNDGVMEPKTLVEIARKRGLNGIAVTDHGTIKGGTEAKKYETEKFKVIIGAEIKTERGEVIGLFLKNEIKKQRFVDVVKEIKRQGGIVMIPHPFDMRRKTAFFPKKEDIKFIDLIEGYNSRCISDKYNKMAIRFAHLHGLPWVAGSDAHFRNEIGNAWTEIKGPNMKKSLINGDIKIWGKRSSIWNHLFTKLIKTKRLYF